MGWSDEMNRIQKHPERHAILGNKDAIRYPYLKCLLYEFYIVDNRQVTLSTDDAKDLSR